MFWKKSVLFVIFIFNSLILPLFAGDIISRTGEHMGTYVLISVQNNTGSGGDPEAALDAAFAEIVRLDKLLSGYKADSEVSILNRQKYIDNPSEELKSLISSSLKYGSLTGGAFDITVQPVLDLYSERFKTTGKPPSPDAIAAVQKKVDYRKIRIEKNKISIGADQEITLGGIAKGYIVDRAITVLKRHGITAGMVNAGGDLFAFGKKNDTTDWKIGLQNPRKENDLIARLGVHDRAVVTSGDYERYFDPEKKYHHIINPKTGYSATELISVTVIAGSAWEADAISTGVFVLGKDKGMAFLESLDGVEGLIITADRKIVKSSGFGTYEW